jgi:hypothetical protein
MQPKRWLIGLAVPALLLAVQARTSAGDPKDQSKVDLKVVKYDELKEAIKKFKGKVVVVDFWADT